VDEEGEVLEKIPAELRMIVKEFCEKVVDIPIEDDGIVPVYLKEHLLFGENFEIISKHRDRFITTSIIFDREFEPFLSA